MPSLYSDPNQVGLYKSSDLSLGPWVYCSSHLRAHSTGWCTVSVFNKLGLGIFEGTPDEQLAKATEKCRYLGLKLFK